MAHTYPQMPSGLETKLAAVRLAAGSGEDAVWYFSDPACPYPVVLKAALQAWLAPGVGGGVSLEGNLQVKPMFQDSSEASNAADEHNAEGVLEEVQRTIEAMRNIEAGLDADDTDGRMSILKSKTALLEKWVQLKERALGLKQMAEFQRLVVQALDEIGAEPGGAGKDAIQTFRKRLAELGEQAV